ncbi:hypothetical protein ACIBTV_19075 [Micromonospora sp. NPDC049366]|uniref:hypothetical protein n=1 Tax=Micromonospora sp. NPDC049366 TaxID=3364271 RepID=UPI0037AF7847
MTPAPPQSPPRSKRTIWLIVSACGALLLLLMALPVGGFLLWLYAGPDLDQPRAVADQFVQQVERNDDVAAYRSLCPDAQERTTLAEFTAEVERLGRPTSHTLGHAAFADEAGSAAFVTVELTDRTGRTTSVDLYLESDAGWQVCGDIFD